MPTLVATTAMATCTFGAAPSALSAQPLNRVKGTSLVVLTANDFAPTMNVKPFGMCSAPSNPQVAAATAAASGVLTPQPCVPATTTPWAPGALRAKVNGSPALVGNCTLNCMWGGVISVTSPGQIRAQGT